MSQKSTLSRRNFLKFSGAAAAAAATGNLTGKKAFAMPNIILQREPLKFGLGGWAIDSITQILKDLDFTGQTGIEVEVLTRPGTPDDMITQMASGAQASNSPYDVIDFEDELAVTGSRAGWYLGLDDLLPSDFWEDWPEGALGVTDVWDRYQGETFRIHHNFEACYWWYRKDWFDEKGIAAPTTWEEVAVLGDAFTDTDAGVWATEDGLISGGYLNVYLACITMQAGGNPFDVGDEFRTALEYVNDLMKSKTLNPASLQKDYDQQNADYIADRVAFMRQWPFFYDLAHGTEDWYADGKAEIFLPPVGPAGSKGSTYAAGWGWGIPKHTKRADEAKELVKWLVDKDNAAKMVDYAVWYLSSRASVLEAAGDEGVPKYLKMYSDAGVLGTRPFDENFVQATSILEESASAYFTDQISLDDAVDQAKSRMGRL